MSNEGHVTALHFSYDSWACASCRESACMGQPVLVRLFDSAGFLGCISEDR